MGLGFYADAIEQPRVSGHGLDAQMSLHVPQQGTKSQRNEASMQFYLLRPSTASKSL